MQWQKLTARSKPKAPCVLARVWKGYVEAATHIWDQDGLELYLRYFRRDYNRFLELPEVE